MNKLRKAAQWAFIAVVGLVVLMAGLGYTMEPNHVATRQALYARTPDEVWDVITRFDQAPGWRTDVDAVEIESGDPIRFVEIGPQGPLPLEVVEQDRPHRLVLMTSDADMPFTGSWTFELQPTDGGTRLTLTERGTIDNPLFRFMARLFMDPAATATTYLVDLGHHLGEEVTPQPPRS
ncbi:SRPBCC family protein [Paraliomyxa miuraensis]|uniref:SRPBCC family protein n=1 Tax=Paraliomyxa miuraensis TaxID=376150 RepID=UPI00224EBBEC|nr:SRPBCC family protein [Paraliomyxa miuraensis]MCX4243791.1 SRPBCC family protein [Paraliomyxa miuraensis]